MNLSHFFVKILIQIRYALDTFAILGGNEYLVSQILEDRIHTGFGPTEKSVLKWALLRIWNGNGSFVRRLVEKEDLKQSH